jgi:hypothetical protein
MSPSIFEAFDNRGVMVSQYLSGIKLQPQPRAQHLASRQQSQQMINYDNFAMQAMGGNHSGVAGMNALAMAQNARMNLFQGNMPMRGGVRMDDGGMIHQRAQRNPSIISFGGRNMSFASEASYGRAMSGLSALSIDWENMEDFDVNVDHSAHINNGTNPSDSLNGTDIMIDPRLLVGGERGGRRSSLRQSFMVGNRSNNNNSSSDNNDFHVSFKS